MIAEMIADEMIYIEIRLQSLIKIVQDIADEKEMKINHRHPHNHPPHHHYHPKV
jgi:hypothetical protein